MNDTQRMLDEDGYQIIDDLLTAKDIEFVERALQGVPITGAGTRNLLNFSWCRTLAVRIASHAAIAAVLPWASCAIQCTFYNKNPDHKKQNRAFRKRFMNV